MIFRVAGFVLIIWFSAVSSLNAQSSCGSILRQARTELNAGDIESAQRFLQDTEICDHQNQLLPERQALQKEIFSTLRSQQQVLEESNEAKTEALASLRLEKIRTDSLLEEVTKSRNFSDSLLQRIQLEKKYSDSLLEITLLEQKRNQKIIQNLFFYRQRLGWAFNGEKFGFMDQNGEVVIPFQYSSATPFNPNTGFAIVEKGVPKIEYLLDTLGNEYQYADELADLALSFLYEIIRIDFQAYQPSFPNEILGQQNAVEVRMNIPQRLCCMNRC